MLVEHFAEFQKSEQNANYQKMVQVRSEKRKKSLEYIRNRRKMLDVSQKDRRAMQTCLCIHVCYYMRRDSDVHACMWRSTWMAICPTICGCMRGCLADGQWMGVGVLCVAGGQVGQPGRVLEPETQAREAVLLRRGAQW